MPQDTTTTDENSETVIKGATEMFAADIPRVDGVAGPASGLPFLIAKALDNDPAQAALLARAIEDHPVDATPEAFADTVVKASATHVEAGNGIEAHGEGEADTRAQEAHALAVAAGTATGPVVQDSPRADVIVAEDAHTTVTKADVPIPQVPTEVIEVTVDVEAPDAGSPAWEAADAANLLRATALILELKTRLQAASDREWAEYMAPGGDSDDADKSWDLCDVVACLDYCLAVVAKITVEEQADAGQLDVVKSLTARLDPATLSGAAAVVKALTRLGSPAVASPEGTEATVADETPVTKATEQAEVTEQEPADVTKSADTDAPTDGAEAVVKSTDEQPPAAEVDLASEVVKALTGDQFGEVLKSAIDGAVEKAVKPLEDRLSTVERQPAPGGPMLRGTATRAGGDMLLVVKGQEATPEGMAGSFEDVQKAVAAIKDPVERDRVSRSLATAVHPAQSQG